MTSSDLDAYQSDTLEWLLQPEQPSVRYLTLRHLMGISESDSSVRDAHAAIVSSHPVRRILSRQGPQGAWGDPVNPYLPKYKSSYWTLMLLGHLAVRRENEQIQRAVEHVFTFQQADGGLAECGREGACRDYDYVARSRIAHGKIPPEESDFVDDYVRQMTLSCLTGNVLAAMSRLGYGDDRRARKAVQWLVSIQHADGGWLCPYWKAHIRDKHSCFYGTICALEGLCETRPEQRTPRTQQAIARGAEFLLLHRLYRSDHHNWEIINSRWLARGFPWFYGYDILRGLWVLGRLGLSDERMDDARTELLRKRTPEGRWILERAPQGSMQASLEKRGQPSKWITLYALWALRDLANHESLDPTSHV
jgi:hypothetical protein